VTASFVYGTSPSVSDLVKRGGSAGDVAQRPSRGLRAYNQNAHTNRLTSKDAQMAELRRARRI
jgi:hypothetical protein